MGPTTLQPEFPVFLRAVRREIQRYGAAPSEINSDTYVVNMQRMAEALAHLILRHEQLPQLLHAVRHRQLALLHETVNCLRNIGAQLPNEVSDASDIQEIGAENNEQVIARYERLVDAQARCLDLLYRHERSNEIIRTADELAAAACELEQGVLAARRKALATIQKTNGLRSDTDDEAVPSDADLTEYLRSRFPKKSEISASNAVRKKGVNTKEIFYVELDGGSDWPSRAVLRRNRPFDTVGNVVSNEFKLLVLLYQSGLPVPRPLVADGETELLKRPFIMTERLNGQSVSLRQLGSAGAGIAADMAMRLAELHQIDPEKLEPAQRRYGSSTVERTLSMLGRFYSHWHANEDQPSTTLDAGYGWLRSNVSCLSNQVAIVHGDYDSRNMLIEDDRITGLLDWELAHEGHPAEDLGYCRPEVERVMPWDEFIDIYRDHGGHDVSDDEVRYFRIWGYVFRASSTYAAFNGFCTGKHSDFLIGSTGFIEYPDIMTEVGALLLDEYSYRPRSPELVTKEISERT